MLHPESSPCSKYINGSLYFLIKLHQTCPLGFNISESAKSCVCEPRLAQYTNQCNITNDIGQITRESGKHFWVGYDHSSILYPQCTFGYCVNNAETFPLNNTDGSVCIQQVRPLVWKLQRRLQSGTAWALINAGSVLTAILPCSSLLQ